MPEHIIEHSTHWPSPTHEHQFHTLSPQEIKIMREKMFRTMSAVAIAAAVLAPRIKPPHEQVPLDTNASHVTTAQPSQLEQQESIADPVYTPPLSYNDIHPATLDTMTHTVAMPATRRTIPETPGHNPELRSVPAVEHELRETLITADTESAKTDGRVYYEDISSRFEQSRPLEEASADYITELTDTPTGHYNPNILSIQSIPLLMRAASYLPQNERIDTALWQLLGGDANSHEATGFNADFVAPFRDAYEYSKAHEDISVMDAYYTLLEESEFRTDAASGQQLTDEQIMWYYNAASIPKKHWHPDFRRDAK